MNGSTVGEEVFQASDDHCLKVIFWDFVFESAICVVAIPSVPVIVASVGR
jgi:hypothetical protein